MGTQECAVCCPKYGGAIHFTIGPLLTYETLMKICDNWKYSIEGGAKTELRNTIFYLIVVMKGAISK